MAPRRARRLLALAVLAIAVASLFPFTPDPPRMVGNRLLREDDGTLTFVPPSRARTDAPPTWLPAAIAGDRVGVVLEARSDDPGQDGPARLLTVSRDFYAADLQVGQAAEDLVVRLRRPGSGDAGDPWYEVEGVFGDRAWHRIEVDVVPGRFTIRVDGILRMDEPLPPDALAGWDPDMRLALGDEVIGERGWSGALREASVTVDDARVDYLAAGALEVPDRWWQLPGRLREPVVLDAVEVVSSVAHALAFGVLGALAVWSRPRRGVLGVAGGALAFALALLVAKVGVDGRHPALHDVAVQTAGAVVGAWWGRHRLRRAAGEDSTRVRR